MATIKYVIQVINDASQAFEDVAGSAEALQSQFDRLDRQADALTATMRLQQAQIERTNVALANLAKNSAAAATAQAAAAKSTAAAGDEARTAYGGYFSLYGIITKLGNAKVPLWWGEASIGGLHLLTDGVIEFAAVLIPAAIALTAFGIAATPVIDGIVHRMENMNTVAKAFNKNVGVMKGGFSSLADSVKPEVYQAFGDYLSVVNNGTGTFAKLASQAGQVVDNWAARLAVVANQKGGLGILSSGASDLAGLGNVVANIGGTIGNVLKAVPGYAAILLQVGVGFSKIAEEATQVAVPVIRAGLALHGFYVYAGLATAAAVAVGKGFVSIATGSFNTSNALGKIGYAVYGAALNIGTWGKSVGTWGKSVAKAAEDAGGFASRAGLAAAGTKVWGGVLAGLSAIPVWGWVALGAGAVVGLTLAILHSKDATTQWIDTLQNAIERASITNGLDDIRTSLTLVSRQAATANKALAALPAPPTPVSGGRGGSFNPTTPLSSGVGAKANELDIGQAQLQTDLSTYTTRLDLLAGTYGTVSKAQGLLVASGVTMKQMIDGSGSAWALIKQAVQGTALAYKELGVQGGTLGNDLDALTRTSTTQYQQMQKINQAWTQLVGNVTGAQTSFDTFAQGNTTLAANFKTATDATATFTTDLGKLHDKVTYAKSSIDSLSASGIALNQAFSAQVTNAEALITSWRTAGIATNTFDRGVKDTIEPLVRYAKGSSEATAQLVALAEQAGYQGPNSLKALTQWLGNTSHAMEDVKKVADQATIQEALLTSAMQAQGSYISNQLIGDMNNAVLATDGVQKAATNYGKALATWGQTATQTQNARRQLILDLIASGEAANNSTGQIAAMITKILGIPTKRALEIVMTGDGTFSVSGSATWTSRTFQAPGGAKHATNSAAGGYIAGPGTSTSDSIPAWLSNGEYVIQAASVHKYGTPMMDMLNAGAYASGGLVDAGTSSVLSGDFAVNAYNSFSTQMLTAMTGSMTAAVNAATSAIAGAFSGSSSSGSSGGGGGGTGGFPSPMPGGGTPAANAALARRMMPSWAGGSEWNAWNYVAMRESGWSQFADNPSSGAYGIAQALPPTKMPFAAQQAGGSSPGAQIAWMISYIRSVYGDPVRAAAHEQAFNWYSRGGPVRRAAGGAVPAQTPSQKRAARTRLTNEQNEGVTLAQVYGGNSISRMISEQSQFLRDIARYYHGSSAAWRDAEVMRQTAKLKEVSEKLTKVQAAISNARQLQGSVLQGLSGATGLGNITVGGGYVGNKFLSGGQFAKYQLGQQVSQMRQFGQALRKLAGDHIGPALLQQIVALGPASGLAMAQEILAGGPSLIKQLAGEQSQLNKIETGISRGVASYTYEGSYKASKGWIDGLVDRRDRLEKLFRQLGRELGEEAAKWFRVPASELPKRLRHHHGGPESGTYPLPGKHHHGPQSGTNPLPGGPQNGTGPMVNGPLVNVEHLTVHEGADLDILGHKINFAVIAAGFRR